MTVGKFNQFSFDPVINEIIKKLHFSNPTKIQEKSIPAIISGQSVVGQSHTGSGKTHAYLLPIFNELDEDTHEVQFVITAPTRELARQLYREVRQMIQLANKENSWFAQLLIGGTEKQISQRKDRLPHIIVGTPGRILDLVNDGVLSIYSAKTLVVDEADLMLDLGFINEIDQLLVRAQKDIQILAFSATVPLRLQHFFNQYLRNPLYIKVDDELFPNTLEHRLVALRHRNRSKLIMELSKVFQPYLALIFTNGQQHADELEIALRQGGLNVGLLHGGLSPRERRRVLNDINNLRYQYIVATDLASRGIDIEGVSHVINAHLPKEEHFYIHRVGRTARAGLEGMAISFYENDDIPLIEGFENKGVTFNYVDVQNGSWVNAQRWDRRAIRKEAKQAREIEQEAWRRVRRPKQVKPGYRKKMKEEQRVIKKRLMNKKRRKRRKK